LIIDNLGSQAFNQLGQRQLPLCVRINKWKWPEKREILLTPNY